MPGGIQRLLTDRVVEHIPKRNEISADWNFSNEGQGVIVKNAFKDFPAAGQGDPTVATFGSNAYYKWIGSSFIKISEAEGLDTDDVSLISGYDASPAIIVLSFDQKREKVFSSPVVLQESKTWQLAEAGSAVRFALFFSLDGEYPQVFPGFQMNSVRWDASTQSWSPPDAGHYQATAVFDSVTWWLHIDGPIT